MIAHYMELPFVGIIYHSIIIFLPSIIADSNRVIASQSSIKLDIYSFCYTTDLILPNKEHILYNFNSKYIHLLDRKFFMPRQFLFIYIVSKTFIICVDFIFLYFILYTKDCYLIFQHCYHFLLIAYVPLIIA